MLDDSFRPVQQRGIMYLKKRRHYVPRNKAEEKTTTCDHHGNEHHVLHFQGEAMNLGVTHLRGRRHFVPPKSLDLTPRKHDAIIMYHDGHAFPHNSYHSGMRHFAAPPTDRVLHNGGAEAETKFLRNPWFARKDTRDAYTRNNLSNCKNADFLTTRGGFASPKKPINFTPGRGSMIQSYTSGQGAVMDTTRWDPAANRPRYSFSEGPQSARVMARSQSEGGARGAQSARNHSHWYERNQAKGNAGKTGSR
jgi:hypothetical protein